MASSDVSEVQLAAALHRASGLLTRALGTALEDASPAEALVLAVLDAQGATPVGDLAAMLGLRPSTCTSILDRLHARKLIVRQVRPDDRRSFLVLITEAGRTQAEAVRERLAELSSAIAPEVSGDTTAALERIGDRLAAS